MLQNRTILGLTILYFIAACCTFGQEFGLPNWLELICKPLLMPLLMLLWLQQPRSETPVYLRVILVALFFCWLGDIFLLFQGQNESYFLLGLGSFLVGHLCYAYGFYHYPQSFTRVDRKKLLLYSIPVVLYYVTLMYMLLPHLGAMKIPVVVYGAVISLMLVSVLTRYGRVPHNNFILVLLGAVMFLISDTCIAMNLFHKPIPYPRTIIMIAYCLGQYLIILGAKQETFSIYSSSQETN